MVAEVSSPLSGGGGSGWATVFDGLPEKVVPSGKWKKVHAFTATGDAADVGAPDAAAGAAAADGGGGERTVTFRVRVGSSREDSRCFSRTAEMVLEQGSAAKLLGAHAEFSQVLQDSSEVGCHQARIDC